MEHPRYGYVDLSGGEAHPSPSSQTEAHLAAHRRDRPRIATFFLSPSACLRTVELPALNLKALELRPANPEKAPARLVASCDSLVHSHQGRLDPFPTRPGRLDERRRGEGGGEAAVSGAKKISKSPVRPWTPSAVDADTLMPSVNDRDRVPAQQSDSPAPSARKERGAAPTKSGAATERAPATKRGGGEEPVVKKTPSTSRQTTPYIDIFRRLTHLDLQGGLRFPTRGGLRQPARLPASLDPAESYYVALLKKTPNDSKILSEYACWLHVEGRFREASKNFRAALTKDPCNPNTFNAFAMLLWEQNRHSKAQDFLKRALLCDPHFVPALFNAGICSLFVGKAQTAMNLFSRVLDLKPGLPAALLGCAIAMEDHGNSPLHEIESLYKRVLNEDPSNFDCLVAYGRFLKNKRYKGKQAEKLYAKALKIQPHDVNLLSSYGVLLMEQCKEPDTTVFEKAAQFFKTALELDTANFEATYNFAVLLMRWERAFGEDLFLRTLLTRRSSPQSPAHGWDNQIMQEQCDKLKPGCPLSSIVIESKNRKMMAQYLYRQALAIKPRDEDVICSYAIFLLQVPVFGDSSILEAERIFHRILHGKFSSSIQSIAMVYYCHLLRTHRENGEEQATAIELARGNWLSVPPKTRGHQATQLHLPPATPPPTSNIASSSLSPTSPRDGTSLSACLESMKAPSLPHKKGQMQEERGRRAETQRRTVASGDQGRHFVVSLSGTRQAAPSG
jgi:Tfp pilus assembly protein PilF